MCSNLIFQKFFLVNLLLVILTTIAGCGYGPEETVTVEVYGIEDKTQQEEIIEKLKTMTDGSGHSISMASSEDVIKVKLAPVSDMEGFAQKIDFGEVKSIEGRMVVVIASKDGHASKPTPYGIDKRPLPIGNDLDTLLPRSIGTFLRANVRGDVQSKRQPIYAEYKSGPSTVFVELGISEDAVSAMRGVLTSKRETAAEFPNADTSIFSVGHELSYFKTTTKLGAFVSWSRGRYYFSVHAKQGDQDLDLFMKDFPF